MPDLPPRARSRSTRPRRLLQLSTLLTILLLVPLLGSAIPAVEAKRTGYFPLKPVMGKRKAGAAVDAGSSASAGAKADTLARRQPLAGAQDTAADAASSTTPAAPAPTPTANAKLQPRATARLGRRKKKDNIPKEKKDYSSFLCPGGSIACPIPGAAGDVKALENQLNSLADWFRIGFECSEVESDVENCGACTSLGQGQDCTLIPNSKSTGCEQGACHVYQCQDGWTMSADRTECVHRPGNGYSTAGQTPMRGRH